MTDEFKLEIGQELPSFRLILQVLAIQQLVSACRRIVSQARILLQPVSTS